MNIFLGYEDFVDIFFGPSQNWASLRVISMQFRVFFWFKHILFDQSLLHRYNIKEVGSDSKP